MNNKLLVAGVSALVLFLTVSAVSASAGKADKIKNKIFGPHSAPERHADMAAMQEALQNKDFEAWKKLMDGKGKISEVIDTQEKFNKFVEAHELMLEKKFDEAKAIQEELGLSGMQGQFGMGMGLGRGMGNRFGPQGEFKGNNKEQMKQFCQNFLEENQ